VGALLEIRLNCLRFLDVFLGYNGQHKRVMHRYFHMNKTICPMEGSTVECIKVLLPKGGEN